MKLSTIVGASVTLPAIAQTFVRNKIDETKIVLQDKEEVLKKSICNLCAARCRITVRIVDGKVVGVSGDSEDPLNQGALCPKGYALLQELYHPDRLQSPLRKLQGGWQSISWKSAIPEIAEKIHRLGSPEKVAFIAGSLSPLERNLVRQIADSVGSSNFYQTETFQSIGPESAFQLMHQTRDLSYDLSNASMIVSFNFDWLQNHSFPVEVHRTFGQLRRGKRDSRTFLIQVEPRLSLTGIKSDQWISIRPNTEGILALGVAAILLNEYHYSQGKIQGFSEFKKVILEQYSPETCARICQVESKVLKNLANDIALARNPLVLTSGENSHFNQVAVHSLNLLIGAIDRPGGVIQKKRTIKSVVEEKILEDIPERFEKGELDGALLFNANPCYASPEPERWRKALQKASWTVSFSSFMDETSELSQLVLPLSTALESFGDMEDYGLSDKILFGFSNPAIVPLYETKSLGDALILLARALGGKASDSFPWNNYSSAVQECFSRLGMNCDFSLDSDLKIREKKISLFPIPSHFESDLFKDPAVLKVPETSNGEFYLNIYTPLSLSGGIGGHLPYLLSTISPYLGEQWDSWVEINPEVAQGLRLSDGDLVHLRSSIGEILVKVRLYPGTRPDTVNVIRGLGHTGLGRYSKGIGSNPAEIVQKRLDPETGKVLWQNEKVKIVKRGIL